MIPTISAIELDCLLFCFHFVKELMGKLKLHYQVLHLLFLFLFAPFQVNSMLKCHPKQSLALLQFKNTTSFDCAISSPPCDIYRPKQKSWLENRDCCLWDGVTWNEVTGNVIGLDLSCSCMKATINRNSSLFHLSHLQWLNLAYNDFSDSPISSEFGRLRELTHLNLSASGFSGQIPSEISHLSKLVLLDFRAYSILGLSLDQQNFVLLVHNLTRLSVLCLDSVTMSSVTTDSLLNLSSSFTYLSLHFTDIRGKIPADVFRLPNLHTLDLSFNYDLTGFLPQSNWSNPLTFLDLSETSFTREIPDSIGNLKLLEQLLIVDCYFTGSIPASIGNLTRLTDLLFERNALTGQVPSSLSKLEQLTYLGLSFNSFTGQILDFGNLSKLNQLHLSWSNFSGPLPYHVNRLSHLTGLDLSDNFFSGKIPSALFSLPSLVYLELKNNIFSGPIDPFEPSHSLKVVSLSNNKINCSIPTSIFELSNLASLDLSSNNFSGSIQFDMLSRLKNLNSLHLSYNSLLSISFDNSVNYTLNNLISFEMSSCNIIGEFPSCLRTFEKLNSLDLSNNKIRGGILKSVSEGWMSLYNLNLSNNLLTYIEHHPWKNIGYLDLSNNLLQGSVLAPPPATMVFLVSNNKLTGIPPSICNLSSLQYISLSNNNLNGKIPPCLGSIDLVMLHLHKNYLHGTIPDTFSNKSSLVSLDVNDNMLEGPLPRSLVNCSQLEFINVGNNKINDIFPYWLGPHPVLKVLVLRSNRFYGPVHGYSKTINPFSKLRIIDLSHNEFTGSLPRMLFENLGEMINVSKNVCPDETFAVSEHKDCYDDSVRYLGGAYYSDSVIVKMKGKELEINRIITIFTSIDMSHNHFHGEIPEVFGNFKSLIVLNLDHNNLTGNIPSSLKNSTALESLDLSSNNLEGKIPAELESLTFLSSLNLSYNNLSGSIPQGGQFSTYGRDSFIGNKGLWGNPLPEKCRNDQDPQAPPAISHGEDNTTREFDWKIAMMGYGSGVVIGLSIEYIVFSLGKPQWLVRIIKSRQRKNVRRSRQRRGS